MSGLRFILILVAVSCLTGCNREPVCETALGAETSSTLPELLRAHDREVREHGKDICYIEPIGSFGRQGVLASLQHVADTGGAVSSYNNTELVFGVAEVARAKTGYDVCKDALTLMRISAMVQATNAPAYQRAMHADLVNGLCKPTENAQPGDAAGASAR